MTTSTLLTRIPENPSNFQGNKFSFLFPTLPFLRYFTQTMSIPSISTNAVKQATPFAGVYRHGDTLVYDTFTISSLVDEDLRVFEETHNWLRALTKPQEYEQYKRFYNKDQKLYHDGVLTINTNANNPNLRISLKNCHPVTLGMIPLDIKGTAEQTMTVDITFQYDYYIIERINQ